MPRGSRDESRMSSLRLPTAAHASLNEELTRRDRQWHEPDNMNFEHTTIMQNAFLKLKELGIPSDAGALTLHTATFVLIMCVPAGYIGLDIRLTLVSLLTWAMLLMNAAGSLFSNTWATLRQCWSQIPWGMVLVFGAVQATTTLVEAYSLLPEFFKLFTPDFWEGRSPVEVQAILATISSVLAEATNNRTLSMLMMPIVQDIAETKNMFPVYYAIPVVVGASSNVIMPVSVPMVIMHEFGRVPMCRLLILGLVLKMVLVVMVLITVNAIGKSIYGWDSQQVGVDA